MFSTPVQASGSRAIVSSALKRAGLIDDDAKMRDISSSDKQGGRKGSSKLRSHRSRPIDALKDRGPASSNNPRTLLASRLAKASEQPDSPISVRGAARASVIPGRGRRVAVTSAPTTRLTKSSIQPWRDLVNKRWNPEARLLNLSSLKDDEIVKQHDLRLPGQGGTTREADVMFKIASKLTPPVLSLDLSNNNLAGVHLSGLARYLNTVANLSLANNNITYGELDMMSGRKERMPQLRELILAGNPIRELEIAKGKGDSHRRAIAGIFPSLNVLDGEPIAKIAFDVPESSTSSGPVARPTATTFPEPMGGSLVVGVDGGMVASFLARYLTTFDTQRATLVDVYHPSSTFSYNLNTSIPERARLQGLHRSLPNQGKLTWGPWLSNADTGSRNLSRVTLSSNIEILEKRLHVGGEATMRAVASLPKTKHDISGAAEKFSLDCFPVPHGQSMALMLTVHGEFVEYPMEGLRSFDRTFILLPAPEGSRAKLNGWDVVIISDSWTVRAYSSCDAWKPGHLHVQAPTKHQQQEQRKKEKQELAKLQAANTLAALPEDQRAALMSVDEQKRLLLLEVIARAKLSAKFAWDALSNNDWDVEKALANFEAVRASLGPEAFVAI